MTCLYYFNQRRHPIPILIKIHWINTFDNDTIESGTFSNTIDNDWFFFTVEKL